MFVAVNTNLKGLSYHTKESYFRALSYVGATPIQINPFWGYNRIDRVLSGCQGLLLIGGPDVPPEFYGGRCHSSIKNPEHWRKVQTDFEMLSIAEKRRIPVLGICAGHQTLGAYFGGKLFQHIPEAGSSIAHQTAQGRHQAVVWGRTADCLLGNVQSVNSRHHQAIESPGELIVEGVCETDGIVEAVRHPKLPIMGVQWHPEDLINEENSHYLFRSFLRGYK